MPASEDGGTGASMRGCGAHLPENHRQLMIKAAMTLSRLPHKELLKVPGPYA